MSSELCAVLDAQPGQLPRAGEVVGEVRVLDQLEDGVVVLAVDVAAKHDRGGGHLAEDLGFTWPFRPGPGAAMPPRGSRSFGRSIYSPWSPCALRIVFATSMMLSWPTPASAASKLGIIVLFT